MRAARRNVMPRLSFRRFCFFLFIAAFIVFVLKLRPKEHSIPQHGSLQQGAGLFELKGRERLFDKKEVFRKRWEILQEKIIHPPAKDMIWKEKMRLVNKPKPIPVEFIPFKKSPHENENERKKKIINEGVGEIADISDNLQLQPVIGKSRIRQVHIIRPIKFDPINPSELATVKKGANALDNGMERLGMKSFSSTGPITGRNGRKVEIKQLLNEEVIRGRKNKLKKWQREGFIRHNMNGEVAMNMKHRFTSRGKEDKEEERQQVDKHFQLHRGVKVMWPSVKRVNKKGILIKEIVRSTDRPISNSEEMAIVTGPHEQKISYQRNQFSEDRFSEKKKELMKQVLESDREIMNLSVKLQLQPVLGKPWFMPEVKVKPMNLNPPKHSAEMNDGKMITFAKNNERQEEREVKENKGVMSLLEKGQEWPFGKIPRGQIVSPNSLTVKHDSGNKKRQQGEPIGQRVNLPDKPDEQKWPFGKIGREQAESSNLLPVKNDSGNKKKQQREPIRQRMNLLDKPDEQKWPFGKIAREQAVPPNLLPVKNDNRNKKRQQAEPIGEISNLTGKPDEQDRPFGKIAGVQAVPPNFLPVENDSKNKMEQQAERTGEIMNLLDKQNEVIPRKPRFMPNKEIPSMQQEKLSYSKHFSVNEREKLIGEQGLMISEPSPVKKSRRMNKRRKKERNKRRSKRHKKEHKKIHI